MHVTTKEVDNDGTHILTSVIEGDGANALCSEKAVLEAKIVSTQRTASGGIQVQTAVMVTEPTPATPEAPKAAVDPSLEEAAQYFIGKGFSAEDAAKQVAKFGTSRVLAMRDKELDAELAAAVAPKEEAAK